MTCWAFQEGDNIFSFSAGEKSRLLQQQLPYLDVVEVARQLPNTVVVKVQPATERFAVDTATGWLVLSDGLKVLRTSGEQPDGLILLDAAVDPRSPQSPGSYLVLQDTTPRSHAGIRPGGTGKDGGGTGGGCGGIRGRGRDGTGHTGDGGQAVSIRSCPP